MATPIIDTLTPCPACSGAAVADVPDWPRKALNKGRARARRCTTCELLFIDPPPPPEALVDFYSPSGGWQAGRPTVDVTQASTRTKGAAPHLFAALDAYFPCSAPTPGSRMLDFGCGSGTWLNCFQDRGWETSGIEPSSDVAFARHARLTEVPTTPTFELVVAYHVLEHLGQPLATLKALAGALIPGGHCFISVPRLDTVAVHGEYRYCLNATQHIVAFTETCMRGLLTRAGLTPVAALHHLDAAFTKGRPLRMRMVARKDAM